MADDCNQCQWAVKRAKIDVFDLLAAFKVCPTWDHFHLKQGKFAFFDSRKRKASK